MLKYLFPNYIKCLSCSKEIYLSDYYGLCEDCYDEIVFTSKFRTCKMCGRPIYREGNYDSCLECQKHGRSFSSGYSCTVYEGLSERIIMAFKYNDKSYLYRLIADIMIEKIKSENISFDYIVYTPVHISRRLIRGFNQTKIIAEYIGDVLGVEVIDNLIIRSKMTKRLKKLTRNERIVELRNAFAFNDSIDISGDVILLIDDIFTTGSTLDACSEILLENCASEIKIITFAVKCNYDYNIYK